jgi:hypothetical protein
MVVYDVASVCRGPQSADQKMYKELISDIATCSDETFVLLTLANNYDRWMSEAQWLERNKDKDPNNRKAKA